MSRSARWGRGGAVARRLRGMVGTSADGGTYVEEREHDDLKLAGFFVGGAVYGIDIMRIKEVIQAHPYPIRPVPHAPPIVEGVIQLRGVVIPVIDLRKRFGVEHDPGVVRLNKLIIVSVRGRIVGLKVDRIIGELRVPAGAVRPAPSMLRTGEGDIDDDFFSGVFRAEIRGIELRAGQVESLPDDEPVSESVRTERRDRKDKEVEEHMVFVVNLETVIDPARGGKAGSRAPASPTEEQRP